MRTDKKDVEKTGLSILQIRDFIATALEKEQEEHGLEKYLETRIDSLHRNISLPDDNTATALIDFVTRYIEHVPDFIDALKELSLSAGIFDDTKVFIRVVEDFFEHPPELIVNNHWGLHALIDEAYLAHRLIEEVNDRVMMLAGIPLAPMDMTISNIVIHDILGEEFANELDLAVHYSIETLFDFDKLLQSQAFSRFVQQHKLSGWTHEIEKWPCLAGDSSITLALEYRPKYATLH